MVLREPPAEETRQTLAAGDATPGKGGTETPPLTDADSGGPLAFSARDVPMGPPLALAPGGISSPLKMEIAAPAREVSTPKRAMVESGATVSDGPSADNDATMTDAVGTSDIGAVKDMGQGDAAESDAGSVAASSLGSIATVAGRASTSASTIATKGDAPWAQSPKLKREMAPPEAAHQLIPQFRMSRAQQI